MAISPPGDIVLDVARAAGPEAIDAARERLAARTASAAGPARAFAADMPADASAVAPRVAARPSTSPFQKFEAMVLQTFVQDMLPSQAEDIYGKGVAGDMWKSMLAEKLADAMAARGGIGIASGLLGAHYSRGNAMLPVGAVSDGAGRTEASPQDLSAALVHKMQLRVARALAEPDEAAPAPTIGPTAPRA